MHLACCDAGGQGGQLAKLGPTKAAPGSSTLGRVLCGACPKARRGSPGSGRGAGCCAHARRGGQHAQLVQQRRGAGNAAAAAVERARQGLHHVRHHLVPHLSALRAHRAKKLLLLISTAKCFAVYVLVNVISLQAMSAILSSGRISYFLQVKEFYL